MKRIDARTVELTVEETAAREEFGALLDWGLTIPAAASLVLRDNARRGLSFTDEFIEYLSEGTVIRQSDRFIVRR